MPRGSTKLGRVGDLSQLAPGLFLSNAEASANEALLGRAKITVAINCADDLKAAGHANLLALYEAEPSADLSDVSRLSWPLPDDPAEDFDLLSIARPLAAKVLDLRRSGERVLLHCVSGRNRSASY